MSYWGKIIGGVAGFAMGGPVGALFGAALGHAADQGALPNVAGRLGNGIPFDSARHRRHAGPARAAIRRQRDRAGGQAGEMRRPGEPGRDRRFQAQFQNPEENVREVGRMFDQARDSADGFEAYAVQLGEVFSDNRGLLEQVLAGLHQIARADGQINGREADYLQRVAQAFGLAPDAARRAGQGGFATGMEEDPYKVLGVERKATSEAIRARWMALMRENHPDSLASRGVPEEFIAAASDRVARINAAYDVIKRERKL